MASLPRPAYGLPARKHSMRPPMAKPSSTKMQSTATSHHGRNRSGTISPAESVASILTARSRSPSAQTGGTKRKQRDFEQQGCEETNIHVVVRCRGRNDREVRENSGVVVSTEGTKEKSVELSMGPSALSNKTYNFDKVFSSAADQAMIYDDVVTPILDEVLSGYNCTIFAYGQTGTGKTYTMSGDMSDNMGMLSDSAGIIPRVLQSLFSKLEIHDAESSVKCSFIELYNEELRDLLSLEENAKLKIFEDGSRKGHSATLVQGMEESHIKSAEGGIKLLQNGSYRRQVAATKCNDLSSRSHTVFTVTVYIKRTAEDGEDFVSAGKLNLVDLAGSENIQRSGAENKRAAEAGLINKSLLTLGRVINALVERSSHIPYRESKLTRLLQDSLGGRTKTCIIATVSPAKSNLEETISTLDYAFRAKNIRNKPQVNQTISKKTLLKEFTAEIEKLKGELIATRQRNGIYLSNDAYEEMTGESESRRILSEEQKARIETMETNLRNKVHELFSLTSNFNILKKDSEGTKAILDNTKGILEKTEFVLSATRQNLAEETMLRRAHQSTEEQLNSMGIDLITTVHKTVSDLGGLRSKIRRKSDLQSLNRENWTTSQEQVSDVTRMLEDRVCDFQRQQDQLMMSLSTKMEVFVQEELGKLEASQSYLQHQVHCFEGSEREVNEQTSKTKNEMNNVLEEIKVLREEVKSKIGEGLKGLSAAAARISAEVIIELDDFHTQLHTSYSSLGRDFKHIFDELTKRLNSQKAEAEDLKKKLASASAAALQANSAASTKLEAVLAEERQQATIGRQNLLSQITNLINTSGEAQDARLTTKIASIQNEISDSTIVFETARTQYVQGMDAWSQKEDILVGEVLKSRETLKSKLKKDWMDANQHNSSIQTTTKSVHEETIRIVDAQIKDTTDQMQALDEFVTRARSQNERHHETHVKSLQGLSGTVRNSYTSIGDHFTSTYSRVRELGDGISEQTAKLQATLPPLDTNLCQPLAELRARITDTQMGEYIPTGETPQKIQYIYPTTLPRTENHGNLIARFKRSTPSTSTSTSPTKIDPQPDEQQQRKSVIFNDASLASSSDEISLVERPTSSSSTGGLREIAVNTINTSSTNTNNTSISHNHALDSTDLGLKTEANEKKPTLIKRHTTTATGAAGVGESKLPSLAGMKSGRMGVGRLGEGRENVPPPTTTTAIERGKGEVGKGRWLRSSPNL